MEEQAATGVHFTFRQGPQDFAAVLENMTSIRSIENVPITWRYMRRHFRGRAGANTASIAWRSLRQWRPIYNALGLAPLPQRGTPAQPQAAAPRPQPTAPPQKRLVRAIRKLLAPVFEAVFFLCYYIARAATVLYAGHGGRDLNSPQPTGIDRSMKRVLVTGGLGLSERAWCRSCNGSSAPRSASSTTCPNPSGDLAITDRIEIVEGDVRDAGAVHEAVRSMDAVVHLAAHTRVIDSIGSAAQFRHQHHRHFQRAGGDASGRRALARERLHRRCHSRRGAPPINEDIAAKPASPYGASKLMRRRLLLGLCAVPRAEGRELALLEHLRAELAQELGRRRLHQEHSRDRRRDRLRRRQPDPRLPLRRRSHRRDRPRHRG